jgi:hypothetical protein
VIKAFIVAAINQSKNISVLKYGDSKLVLVSNSPFYLTKKKKKMID